MLASIAALVFGLALLVWSADRFLEGAVNTAGHFKVPPMLIGMVIVGFGTSAPEMVVSDLASWKGNPGIARGNAIGSNIANIALVLGAAALLNPILVRSETLRKELPILVLATALAILLFIDLEISRWDAGVLLLSFGGLMAWTLWRGSTGAPDTLAEEVKSGDLARGKGIGVSLFWLVGGLLLLILSSRVLVWGGVGLARTLGMGEILIGLTIIAVGTSLPELASSIIAAHKGAHDIAFGNILGSNLFNTLAVVGIAGSIEPIELSAGILYRDLGLMAVLTVTLFVVGVGFRGKPGRINRYEGAALLFAYIAYLAYLIGSSQRGF